MKAQIAVCLSLVASPALAADPQPAAASSSTDAAMPWKVCLLDKVREFATSAEPAATVADAAIGACGAHEEAAKKELRLLVLKAAMYGPSTGSPQHMASRAWFEADVRFDAVRERLRGKMLAYAMELRASQASPR
jgi:hypothetical protein